MLSATVVMGVFGVLATMGVDDGLSATTGLAVVTVVTDFDESTTGVPPETIESFEDFFLRDSGDNESSQNTQVAINECRYAIGYNGVVLRIEHKGFYRTAKKTRGWISTRSTMTTKREGKYYLRERSTPTKIKSILIASVYIRENDICIRT